MNISIMLRGGVRRNGIERRASLILRVHQPEGQEGWTETIAFIDHSQRGRYQAEREEGFARSIDGPEIKVTPKEWREWRKHVAAKIFEKEENDG